LGKAVGLKGGIFFFQRAWAKIGAEKGKKNWGKRGKKNNFFGSFFGGRKKKPKS
jgi:hypothetical protein